LIVHRFQRLYPGAGTCGEKFDALASRLGEVAVSDHGAAIVAKKFDRTAVDQQVDANGFLSRRQQSSVAAGELFVERG